MTSKFLRVFLAASVLSVISALAQGSSASSPAAPAATTGGPAGSSSAAGSAGRVGTINVEQAVFESNEGRRDFEALNKKLEPKQVELKGQNDELEALQKQLQTQQDKLNAEALASLQRQIESKKKSFDRSVQDAQEDYQGQQKEIFQRVLQKMAPLIVKYAQDNSFSMIVDISNPWPQSPILWAGEGADITKPVVDAYNAQSGVPAPATAGGAAPKPGTTKPAGTATPKPAAPKPADAPK